MKLFELSFPDSEDDYKVEPWTRTSQFNMLYRYVFSPYRTRIPELMSFSNHRHKTLYSVYTVKDELLQSTTPELTLKLALFHRNRRPQ